MKLNRLSIHLIILLAAVVFAVLFDIQALTWMWEVDWNELEIPANKKWDVGMIVKLSAVVWNLIIFILSFYTLVVSNLLLYQKLNSRSKSPVKVFSQLLVYNLIIYAVISMVGSWAFQQTFKPDAVLSLRSLLSARYILMFVLSVSIAYLLVFFFKSRRIEIDNLRLQEEKTRAELSALKEQISPHFFFNTLNSLSALIRTNSKDESLEFVENLSEVYRYTLDSGMKDLVPISEELKFVDAYFELLRKRFGDKLVIDIQVDEEDQKLLIPPMALQVLLENVIKHNKLTKEGPLFVKIYLNEDMLHFENNLRKKKGVIVNGLGLANLNRRCQLLTGREISIQSDRDMFKVKVPIIKG